MGGEQRLREHVVEREHAERGDHDGGVDGAPDALRISAGTPEEVAFFGDALAALEMPIGAGAG